jgi:ubiquinone biosynthesis protein
MKIVDLKQKYGEMQRAIEIVETFFRYGLEDLFDATSLAKRYNLSLGSEMKGKKTTTPEKVRMALEELGPTFVKLGQLLSTRPDILPPGYITEFQKLQDKVPPFPFHEVKAQIHSSLGATVETIFKEFGKEPVASASIAQVHAGVLHEGTKVAVKIKRPDIEAIIASDTRIILELAQFVSDRHLVDEIWRPLEIAEQFDRSIREELDFGNEIANQKKFFENFADEKGVRIPKVFDDYSSRDIITMEYLEGVKLNKVVGSRGDKYPKKEIASIGAAAVLKQVFLDHVFHGDLHPGNLFWLEGEGRLGFVDFGLAGRLDEVEGKALTAMLYGIVNRDSEKVLLGIEGLEIIDSSQQSGSLKREVDALLDKYFGSKLKDIKMAPLIQEIFGVMLKLRIRLPVDLVVLAKTLVSVEGLAESLDPDFNLFQFSKPYVEAAVRQQFSVGNVKKDAENTLMQSARLMKGLPNDLYWLLRNLKNNDFKVKVEHQRLGSLLEEIERIGNRLSFSLIVAGLIIGSSYLMPTYRQLGLAGYLIASLMGVALVISMFRRNKL